MRIRPLPARVATASMLIAGTALSGCSLPIGAVAQAPTLPISVSAPLGVPGAPGLIFTPCLHGADKPHAFSAVSDLLLGKDRYAVDCTHQIERRADTAVHPSPETTGELMVSDELISAVLTGTGEYLYQPAIGPA